jgi:hypothetical protein
MSGARIVLVGSAAPRHRGAGRRFGGVGRDDEQVELLAAVGGGDGQGQDQTG